jgi:hypothetical protein
MSKNRSKVFKIVANRSKKEIRPKSQAGVGMSAYQAYT